MTTVLTDGFKARASAGVSVAVPGGPGQVVVALRGDLDMTTAPELREDLLSRLDAGAKVLIIDLSDVSFCDAAGLAILVGTLRRATLLGITLRLAGPPPMTAKMLHITGLDRIFGVHPTVADALMQPVPVLVPSLPIRHHRERVPVQPPPGRAGGRRDLGDHHDVDFPILRSRRGAG